MLPRVRVGHHFDDGVDHLVRSARELDAGWRGSAFFVADLTVETEVAAALVDIPVLSTGGAGSTFW